MATFSIYIYKNKARSDGRRRVYIRFTHKREVKDIPTMMYVEKKDLTASFKIKNNVILDRCDELIRRYKTRMYALNLEVNDIDFKDVVRYITASEQHEEVLSFTAWADKWISKKNTSSAKNYKTALNSFCRYLNRNEVLFTDVTTNTLNGFVRSLLEKPRAASLYPNALVKMFNDAREYYNDEDNGIVRIRHTLRKFQPPKQNVAEKRALTIEQIRKIFTCPYDNIKIRGLCSRHDLALDCFRLSFALMGMNSVDMYHCDHIRGDVILYDRSKTKDRRTDRAHMEVKIPSTVMHIFEKWRDPTGEKVFSFYQRFSSPDSMNKYINQGLKSVGIELGIDNLQFYSARHSMATIGVNDLGINPWTVNLMLCHTGSSMKMTELYIKKDYTQENEAMKRIMEYVISPPIDKKD